MALVSDLTLKQKLAHINQQWDANTLQGLIDFYVSILPCVFSCQRCAIFVVDSDTNKVSSVAGTQLQEGELEFDLNGSIAGEVIEKQRPIRDNALHERTGIHQYLGQKTGYVMQSVVCVPLFSAIEKKAIGAVQISNCLSGDFSIAAQKRLSKAAHFIALALESLRLGKALLSVNDELELQLSSISRTHKGIIAESSAMRDILQQAKLLAPMPLGVMITGENGTGKEEVAQYIHQCSDRANGPFIAINCAAIPENLVESELFGHEKGAFTGSVQAQSGKFEQAKGGTLFLDEVGELPLPIQAKLLRAVQEKVGRRLGGQTVYQYDFRLLSATNRDLKTAIANAQFREDLYYRLFSIHIHIPPLRERKEDILALTAHFVKTVSVLLNKEGIAFSEELVHLFEHYSWPGNVRQLRREIERILALSPSGELLSTHYCSQELLQYEASAAELSDVNSSLGLSQQVAFLEKKLIKDALNKANNNRVKAAKLLGLSRAGLYKKLKRYDLFKI